LGEVFYPWLCEILISFRFSLVG